MISIEISLVCDGCLKTCPGSRRWHRDTVMRREIEASRDAGRAKGWRRYRLKNTGPNGDYCPACQARQRKAATKGAAK